MNFPKRLVLPQEVDFAVEQGADFSYGLQWGSTTVVQKAITAVSQAAPPALTVASHGMPAAWPFWIDDVKGMWQINNPFGDDDTPDNDPYVAGVPDANTITIPGLSAIAFAPYKSGGSVLFFTPQDLSVFTAKLQIRANAASGTVILELTQGAGITLDNTGKTITVALTGAQTAALPTSAMRYDLKLTSAGGVATRLAEGRVRISPAVTR